MYKYYKRKVGYQALFVAGVMVNNATVLRYEEDKVPVDVKTLVRQRLLVEATKADFDKRQNVGKEAAANVKAKADETKKKRINETLTLGGEGDTLTPAQKAAITRAENKAKKEAEAAAKTEEEEEEDDIDIDPETES